MNAIYTIGHGNRTLEDLFDVLDFASIRRLVDVRAHPGSRRHPQFGRGALEQSVPQHAIEYVWRGEALGGRRRARADSPHQALRNESFRAYADHMQSESFRQGIEELLEHAREARVAIMCAERLPWQCHRFLIADYLVARGHEVLHLIDTSPPRAHALHATARVQDADVIYDRGTDLPLQ